MKATVKSIGNTVNQLLDIPSLDPDDARRRKLLNILLAGATVICGLGIVATITVDTTASLMGSADLEVWANDQQRAITYLVAGGGLVTSAVIYVINRHGSGWLASTLFLLVSTVLLVFSDTPDQVASGSALLGFAIPIMMASVILRPYASFIMAGLSSLLHIPISLSVGWMPNPFAVLIFFMIALVSWLAAHSLERALKDLRTLNLELDQHVAQRTGELRAILNSTADGIVVFDIGGKASIANPATEHLLGQPASEIVGHGLDGLMRDRVNDYDREVISDIIHDATVHYPSLKVKWNDKTLSMSAAPVKLESGKDIGTVAVFRDFTKEAEVDRMKSAFLSIASHDLRSPLSAILGLTELVREGVYTSLEEQRHAIDRIYSNTQYMLSLANSLLGQAQIEAGILKLRPAPLSPTRLIESVSSAMEVLAHSKGIELAAHVADEVPEMITGDQEKLSQVLFNLVGNAIKFTNKGSVEVHAYAPEEGCWALAVSDTGRGIPEEAQPIVFESFLRVEGTSASGVGLGLSIVKQLVELMGGEILLDSQVGVGSTFTVVLPVGLDQVQD